MRNVLIFHDPEAELQNLISLAYAQIDEACTITGCCPSAEELYPELCHFAQQHGFSLSDPIVFSSEGGGFRAAQLNKLSHYIEKAFAIAPHLVTHFLTIPSVPKPTPTSTLTLAPDPETKKESLPLSKPSLPSTAPMLPVEKLPSTPPTPVTGDLTLAPTKEGHKDPAYDAAMTILQFETIRILGEAIYVHRRTHFEHLSAENLQRLIFKYCEAFIEKCGNCNIVDRVFKVLLTYPKIYKEKAEIDPRYVSFQNGVLDLQTGKLDSHNPRFNTFYCVQANYGYPGPHPVFDQLLDTITGCDRILRQRILEAIGCCLVPGTESKSFFVFQGVTDSGKSKLGEFIRKLINQEASSAVEISTLGNRFGASELVGKQLSLALDMPSAPMKDSEVSTFKKFTGGDPLTADVKYRPLITFTCYAKFILATNFPLTTSTHDPALFRRAVVIPFRYSVPLECQNHNLVKDLMSEADAVVFECLRAYWELEANHFRFSGDYMVNDMFENCATYSSLPDVSSMLRDFIQNNCIVREDQEAFVDDLYQAFVTCYGNAAIASTQFSSKLLDACQQLGLTGVRKTQKKRRPGESTPIAHLEGISLRT